MSVKKKCTGFSKKDLINEIKERYQNECNKNPELYNAIQQTNFTKPKMCELLGIPKDSNVSIETGREKILMGLQEFIDNNYSLSDPGVKPCTSLDRSQIITALRYKYKSLKNYYFQEFLLVDPDGLNQNYFNMKVLCILLDSEFDIGASEEELIQELNRIKKEIIIEIREQNDDNDPSIHSLNCPFIQNYKEIDFLKFEKILLNIFSKCVKKNIDIQNSIISMTYLDEYKNKYKDDSTKKMATGPICDIAEGQKISMYDHIINELNKLNGKVLHDTRQIGKEFDDDILINLSYSTNVFDKEIKKLYEFVSDQTNNFEDVPSIIYYLNFFNLELRSLIKQASNSLGKLLEIIPILKEQLYALIIKSKRLEINKSETTQQIRNILKFYNLDYIVDDLVKEINILFIKHVLGDNMLSKILLDPFKAIKSGYKDLQKISNEVKAVLDMLTEPDSKIYINKILSIIGFNNVFDKLLNQMDIINLRLVLSSMIDKVEKINNETQIIGNDFEQFYINSLLLINDGLKIISGKSGLQLNDFVELDLDKLIELLNYISKLPDDLDSKIQYFKTVASNLKEEEKEIQQNQGIDTSSVKFSLTAKFLVLLNTNPRDILFKSTNPDDKDIDNDKVSKIWDFVESLSLLSENAVTNLREYLISKRDTIKMTIAFFKGYDTFYSTIEKHKKNTIPTIFKLIEPILYYTPFQYVINLYTLFKPKKYKLEEDLFELIKQFDITKPGKSMDLIISSILYKLEKHTDVDKLMKLKDTALPLLTTLVSLFDFEKKTDLLLLGYTRNMLSICSNETNKDLFESCIKNETFYILTIFIERTFDILKNFISDNYTKNDKLYSVVPVLDSLTPEQKQKYAFSIVEEIYDILTNLLKWSNKKKPIESKIETDEFNISGSLLTVKNRIMTLFIIVTELIPDLKKNQIYFTFILDIMFVCLQKIKDSNGIFLLANQFIYAYVNNLSNPKSDIYKAILSHDLTKIVLSFIQITAASFPTLLLKFFQIADTIVKSTDFADIWTSIVGKKLKYPVMGDKEVKIIANRVLFEPSITIRGKEFFKVQDILFPASVGQVHDFKTEEQLELTHTEFEKQFLETVGMMKKDSDEFKINKYLYNKSLIISYKKELKEDIDDLKTNFEAIYINVLDNFNVQILKKINWQNLKNMSNKAIEIFNNSSENVRTYEGELTRENESYEKRKDIINRKYVKEHSQTEEEHKKMLEDKYYSDTQLFRLNKNIEKINQNISHEKKIQTHKSAEAYKTYIQEFYLNMLNLLMYYLIRDKSKLYKLDIMKDDNEILAKLFDMKLNSINLENQNTFFNKNFLKKIDILYKYFNAIYTDLPKILDRSFVELNPQEIIELKDRMGLDYFFNNNISEFKELLNVVIPDIETSEIDIIISALEQFITKTYTVYVSDKIIDKIGKIEPIDKSVIKKYIIENIIEVSASAPQNYTSNNEQLLNYFQNILKDKQLMDFFKPILLNYNSYVHNTETYRFIDHQDILIFVKSLQNVLCTYDFNRALLNYNVLTYDSVIDRFINKGIKESVDLEAVDAPGYVDPESDSKETDSNLRKFYTTHTKKIKKLITVLKNINDNFSILVENGIDNYLQYSVIPNTISEIKKNTEIFNNKLAEYQLKQINVAMKIKRIESDNVVFESDADLINRHKNHMEGIYMNAFVQKARLQKYIIKFVKIRSRLGLCIEKSVIPDSVRDVVNVYRNKNFDTELMKKIIDTQEIVTCKIKAVSDEFDLWEELVNTNTGKQLYDYPESFKGDYDKTDYYRIRVTDVMMSFDKKNGIKPLYNVEGEYHEFKNFKNQDTPTIKIQKGFYTAMIQERMPGRTLGDLEKENMSKNELDCLQKTVIKYFTIYLSTIMIDGKYHGDPHPGNVMWDYDYLDKINGSNIKIGQLSIIDFGDWVEIESDVRFSVLSIVLFILFSFVNPYPDIISGEFISRNFAKLIVASLQIDHYDAETLKNLYVNNKLYKDEKDIELIDVKLAADTLYKNNIIEQCKYILSSRFSDKLFTIYKKISKSYEGGDFLTAMLTLQDSEILNSIFHEVNNIHENISGILNCEKLGIRVTKLLEAISKLHGFTKYINLNISDMLNTFFMTIETVIDKTQTEYEQTEFLNVFAQIKLTITLLLKLTGNIDIAWTSIYSMTTAISSIEMDPNKYHPAVYAIYDLVVPYYFRSYLYKGAQMGIQALALRFGGTEAKATSEEILYVIDLIWNVSNYTDMVIGNDTKWRTIYEFLDWIYDKTIGVGGILTKNEIISQWKKMLVKLGIKKPITASAESNSELINIEEAYKRGILEANRYIRNNAILNQHFIDMEDKKTMEDKTKELKTKTDTRMKSEMELLNTKYAETQLRKVDSTVTSFLNIFIDFIKQIIAKLCYNNIIDQKILSTGYGIVKAFFEVFYKIQTNINMLEYLVKPTILGSDILISQNTDLTYYLENHSNIYTSININPVLHKYLYYLKNKKLQTSIPDNNLEPLKSIYNDQKRYKQLNSDYKISIDKISYKLKKLRQKIKYINTETDIKLQNISDKLKLYNIVPEYKEDQELDFNSLKSLFTDNQEIFNDLDDIFIKRLIKELDDLYEKDSLDDLYLKQETYEKKITELIKSDKQNNTMLIQKNKEYNQGIQNFFMQKINNYITITINNENLYNLRETIKEQIQNYIKLSGIQDNAKTKTLINETIIEIYKQINLDTTSENNIVNLISNIDESLKLIKGKINNCMNIHEMLSKHISSLFLYIKQQQQLFNKNEKIKEKITEIDTKSEYGKSYSKAFTDIMKILENKYAYLKYILFLFVVNYRKLLNYKIDYSKIITDNTIQNKQKEFEDLERKQKEEDVERKQKEENIRILQQNIRILQEKLGVLIGNDEEDANVRTELKRLGEELRKYGINQDNQDHQDGGGQAASKDHTALTEEKVEDNKIPLIFHRKEIKISFDGHHNIILIIRSDPSIYNGAFVELYRDMISREDTYKNYIKNSFSDELKKINGYSKKLCEFVLRKQRQDTTEEKKAAIAAAIAAEEAAVRDAVKRDLESKAYHIRENAIKQKNFAQPVTNTSKVNSGRSQDQMLDRELEENLKKQAAEREAAKAAAAEKAAAEKAEKAEKAAAEAAAEKELTQLKTQVKRLKTQLAHVPPPNTVKKTKIKHTIKTLNERINQIERELIEIKKAEKAAAIKAAHRKLDKLDKEFVELQNINKQLRKVFLLNDNIRQISINIERMKQIEREEDEIELEIEKLKKELLKIENPHYTVSEYGSQVDEVNENPEGFTDKKVIFKIDKNVNDLLLGGVGDEIIVRKKIARAKEAAAATLPPKPPKPPRPTTPPPETPKVKTVDEVEKELKKAIQSFTDAEIINNETLEALTEAGRQYDRLKISNQPDAKQLKKKEKLLDKKFQENETATAVKNKAQHNVNMLEAELRILKAAAAAAPKAPEAPATQAGLLGSILAEAVLKPEILAAAEKIAGQKAAAKAAAERAAPVPPTAPEANVTALAAPTAAKKIIRVKTIMEEKKMNVNTQKNVSPEHESAKNSKQAEQLKIFENPAQIAVIYDKKPLEIFDNIETKYHKIEFELWEDMINILNKNIHNNVSVAMYDLLNI
jgi:hypothetical protein